MKNKILLCIAVLAFIFSTLALTGCSNYSEVYHRIIIKGISVDVDDKNDYIVALESLIMPNSPESPIISTIVKGKGNTILSAIQNAAEILPEKPYYGDMEILFVSEKYSKKGIVDLINLLVQHSEFNASTIIAVIADKAVEDLFNSKVLEDSIVSSDIVTALVDNTKRFGTSNYHVAYQVFNCVLSENKAYILPRIDITEEQLEEKTARTSGGYIFKKDKLIAEIDDDEFTVFNLVTSQFDKGYYTLTNNEKPMTLSILDCQANIKWEGKNKDSIISKLKLRTSLNIIANNKEEDEVLSKKFKDELNDRLIDFIKKTQEIDCDVWSLGDSGSKNKRNFSEAEIKTEIKISIVE